MKLSKPNLYPERQRPIKNVKFDRQGKYISLFERLQMVYSIACSHVVFGLFRTAAGMGYWHVWSEYKGIYIYIYSNTVWKHVCQCIESTARCWDIVYTNFFWPNQPPIQCRHINALEAKLLSAIVVWSFWRSSHRCQGESAWCSQHARAPVSLGTLDIRSKQLIFQGSCYHHIRCSEYNSSIILYIQIYGWSCSAMLKIYAVWYPSPKRCFAMGVYIPGSQFSNWQEKSFPWVLTKGKEISWSTRITSCFLGEISCTILIWSLLLFKKREAKQHYLCKII